MNDNKVYSTMGPMVESISALKKSLEEAGHLKEMNLTKPGIDKGFYDLVKAYKLLFEDVNFLHRHIDELEEEVAQKFSDEFCDLIIRNK